VPLVDNYHDFLFWASVNLSEEVIISPVNENAFELGEENCQGLNVPVDEVWVQTLF
jgi:hypothetical protein